MPLFVTSVYLSAPHLCQEFTIVPKELLEACLKFLRFPPPPPPPPAFTLREGWGWGGEVIVEHLSDSQLLRLGQLVIYGTQKKKEMHQYLLLIIQAPEAGLVEAALSFIRRDELRKDEGWAGLSGMTPPVSGMSPGPVSDCEVSVILKYI